MTNIDTIEILNNLISYPTVSRDANINLIDYIAELISCDNVKPVIIKNKEKSKANLFASIGPKNSEGVMLSGHTDVVPIDGQDWTKPPFECTYENGLYYGRGTADMKGFVACAVNAFIKAKQLKLTNPLVIVNSLNDISNIFF